MKLWNNTKLTYSVLRTQFITVFGDNDVPGYTRTQLVDWVTARFTGWYSMYKYDINNPSNKSDLTERLVYYWALNKERVAHFVKTTQYEYNPLENYDMTETATDTTESSSDGKSTATGKNKVNTYLNDSTAYPENESTTDSTTAHNSSDTNTHTLTRHGNIGVTTSQQMLESERKLVVEPLSPLYDVFLPCFDIEPVICEV